MRSKLLDQSNGKRTYVLVFAIGDEVTRGLLDFAALSPTGEPGLHAHVAVARRDGTALGGHLLEAHVRPTLEVVLTESPTHLQRTFDPRNGLAFISTD